MDQSNLPEIPIPRKWGACWPTSCREYLFMLDFLRFMKKDIHPTYYADATVVCACGNTFTTGSTVQEIRVEICSNCHPFYTGKQKYIDTAGRVDRFKKIQKQASDKKTAHVTKRQKGIVRKTKKQPKAEKEESVRSATAEKRAALNDL